MRPSTLLLKIGRIHPVVADALARGWQAVRGHDNPPHWVLLQLREIANSRTLRALPVGTTLSILVPANGWISSEARRLGSYEPATTAICRAILRPGMVAIDVGANVGYFTLLFAETVGSQGRVIAFEPCSSVYKLLRRNVSDNGLHQVHTVRGALSNASGRLHLYIAGSDVTHSLRPTRFTTELTETIDATTLDAWVKELELPQVDLVKIDVEGADLHVLEGASMTLVQHRPYVIVEASDSCAAFGYRPEALLQRLEQDGYRVCAIDQLDPLAWSGNLGSATYVNLLAVPMEKAERLPEFLDIIAGIRQRIAEASRRDA